MKRAPEDSRVFEALCEALPPGSGVDIDPAIVGALSDAREVGSDDLDEEDVERGGRLVFAVEEEGAPR